MLNHMMLCEELFHTPSGVAFADFITVGHRETWPIRSKRFRTWLRRCYYQATGDAPSAAALRSALDLLEARAQFDAPERGVNIRVADSCARQYYGRSGPGAHDVRLARLPRRRTLGSFRKTRMQSLTFSIVASFCQTTTPEIFLFTYTLCVWIPDGPTVRGSPDQALQLPEYQTFILRFINE
jgi:hypothetical protein